MGKAIGATPETIVADASRKPAALAAYMDFGTKQTAGSDRPDDVLELFSPDVAPSKYAAPNEKKRGIMFALLVKIRLLSLWNVARFTASRYKLLTAGLVILGMALFLGIYHGFRVFLTLVRTPGGTEELVYEVFYFLFLFLLAGAVPFVASTLLHSTDYLLLSAAPVRPRAVVAAKLLDATVTNSLQFTVIGVPAIAACGTALGLPASGWLVLALLILLFVLLPALVTAFGLLIALAILGMRKVRSAITAVNAIMATVVCLTIVLQASRLQLHQGFHYALTPTITSASPSAHYGPSGWFAWALIALAGNDAASGLRVLGGLALLIGLLYAACMQLGGHMLSAASLAEESEGETPAAVPVGEIQASRRGLLSIFSSPVAAIICKDLKYLLRDSILLSQLGMPVILFFVPFVLAMQESVRSLGSPVELYPFAAGMTGIIIFMQTSIISLSSIGLESRSFWLVLSSPNAGRTLLWAKFVMSTLVSAGVGLFLTLISAFVFRAPLVWSLIQCGAVVLSCAALCGMGVGISASLPRFVYDNPAHRVSIWALILGFVASMVYLILISVVFVTILLLAEQMAEHALLIYAFGAGVFLLVTLAAALIPMVIGAQRIDIYQWEY